MFGPGSILDVPLDEAHHLFARNSARPAPPVGPDWTYVPTGEELCGPEGFRCPDAKDHSRDRRACRRAIVRELLRFVGAQLDAYGVTWWADYGTLAGALRFGGMIPWDKDADIGILEEHAGRVRLLGAELKSMGMGFDVSGIGTLKFRCSRTNETNLDAFSWFERPDGMMDRRHYAPVDRYKGRAFHREDLFPLSTVEFDGLKLPAPRDPEAFVLHRFPSWVDRAPHDGVLR